jgi:arsenate reductase (thioredoxin)
MGLREVGEESGMISGDRTERENRMGENRRLVFVCLHGSAKSLIAAEHFRRLAERQGMKMDVISAGTEPDLDIPTPVIAGLLEDGIDVRGRRPRQATREELAGSWRVVSFGCDLADMAPPSVPVERWDDIPAVSEDFGVARDRIVDRLARLLAECRGMGAVTTAEGGVECNEPVPRGVSPLGLL